MTTPDRSEGLDVKHHRSLLNNPKALMKHRKPAMKHRRRGSFRTRILAVSAVIALVPAILIAGHGHSPAPTQTVASTCVLPQGSFSIAVCGNQFVNQAGQPVVLRGANTEGTQYDCAQDGAGFFDDSTIDGTDFSTEIAAMKAWGINVVRVNLNEECWLGINGVPDTTSAMGSNGYNAYANAMGSYVTALNAAGIYAEVDLHLNAPGSELISDAGNDDFQNPLPESNSDAFWKSVAAYFINNHAVIFGVFNEPFPPNAAIDEDTSAGWDCDLNGCTVPDYTDTSNYNQIPSGTYAGEGMLQMIDDIRSVNTTAPLLVGGPDFAGDLDQWLATFYPGGVSVDPSNQLAASVHVYFPGGNSPCSLSTDVASACPGIDQGALGNDGILQVASVTPVEIDELGDFGCSAQSLTPFLASVDAADDSGSVDVGYVGWAWTTSDCDPNLITDYSTGQPSQMGAAEYCELFLQGLNDGSLTTCAGTPVNTTTTTTSPTATTTTSTTTTDTSTTTTSTEPPTTTTTSPSTTTTTSGTPPSTSTTTTEPATTTTTEPPTTTTEPPTTTTTDPDSTTTTSPPSTTTTVPGSSTTTTTPSSTTTTSGGPGSGHLRHHPRRQNWRRFGNSTICQVVNNRYFDATTLTDGNTVSLSTAAQVEALFEHASGDLFNEAEPLQQAISADDESGIVDVLTFAQNVVCPSLGVPAPT
jgi:Cellulase (glycosyl hydrolase family 5)